MKWTRRTLASTLTWLVVLAWLVFYVIALATSDPLPAWDAAIGWLVVPPLMWVLAVRLLLRHLPSGPHDFELDPPGRILTAAVAALPERRREWGAAMLAELAEVRGRSDRWRFALSCSRATVWVPPVGGWAVLVFATGLVVVSVAVVGSAVETAVPGLDVFAMTFTGLVGAMALLAVARSPRLRLPVPVPTVVVTGGVAAAIAAVGYFLHRQPAAAPYLPPVAAVFLAVCLAGCVAVAVAPPRWLGADRLPPHLGAAAAVVFGGWFLLSNRLDGTEPPMPLLLLLGLTLALSPFAIFAVPAFVAGRAGRSLRAGIQAVVWTIATTGPLTYAIWLHEGLRRHAIDGRSLDGEIMAPVGVNLTDGMIFCFGIFPVFGLTLGMIGAALGARRAPPDPERNPVAT
jgi:hypothetical protein